MSNNNNNNNNNIDQIKRRLTRLMVTSIIITLVLFLIVIITIIYKIKQENHGFNINQNLAIEKNSQLINQTLSGNRVALYFKNSNPDKTANNSYILIYDYQQGKIISKINFLTSSAH